MRNNTLDLAKLVAAFFIMVVHVGFYQELPGDIGDFFRISSRWALPFFFLASGYLMGIGEDLDIGKKVNKILSIIFYASLLFIPIIYRMQGYDLERLISKVISNELVSNGVFFHLWFLYALIIGILLTNYAIKNSSIALSSVISVLLVLGCWYGDLIKSLGFKIYIFYAFRTLISFSLVYLGFIFAKNKTLSNIDNRISVLVIICGISLMVIESYVLHNYWGADLREKQFPLFSVPVCIALLSLCVNYEIKNNYFSKLGKDYALGIYIVHPFLLYYVQRDIGGIFTKNSLANLFAGFIGSIIFLFFVKKFIPVIYNKLNGIGVN